MPPRIPTSLAASCCRKSLASSVQPSQPSLVSLVSALSLQTRSASILASLSDNPGAYNKKIRKGRGASSGYGKTSGRGHKGTGQRGKLNPWFQGGQTPLVFVNGRKGEDNIWAAKMSEVNLDRIQQWIDAGRLDPTKQIGPKEIIESGLIGSLKDGIKILARNADVLKQPLDIIVSRASAKAIEAVEKAGGRVVTRYYTKQSIRRLLNGTSVNTDKPLPVGAEHVDDVLEASKKRGFTYRLPDPTSRWDIEYYRDPAHRGYLSHKLQPGESPSLYFKVPTSQKKVYPKKEKAASTEITTNKDVNRLF